jgi:hypothetical protein
MKLAELLKHINHLKITGSVEKEIQELNLIPGKLFPGRLLLLSGESMWMATGLFSSLANWGNRCVL